MLKVYSCLRPLWVALLVLVVASCGGGSGGGSGIDGGASPEVAANPAPIARVDAPIDGSVVKSSRTTIEGVVDPPDATVTVGGVAATVVNGRFSAAVDLNEGANSIQVVAQSEAGATTTSVAVTLNTTEMCGTGDTFTVALPGVKMADDPSTMHLPDRTLPNDSVTLPDGCDVYAILVHGYGRNDLFEELMFYNLAKWVAEHNGYVHWSWWNNFVGQFMSRPLHVIPGTARGDSNYPYPGDITELENVADFNVRGGKGKAVPDDDYQFQADVKRVLTQIRDHNPDAIVIVAGHSMGGNAVIRLGEHTTVPIDLLAPIDAVGNRNLPQGRGNVIAYGVTRTKSAVPGTSDYDPGNETFNWTRWRATHAFPGWIDRDCVRNALHLCKDFDPRLLKTEYHCTTVATGLDKPPLPSGLIADMHCPDEYSWRVVRLPTQIRRLYYRWQQETWFPYDWDASYNLAFTTARLHNEQPFNVSYHNYQRAVGEYVPSDLPLPGSHPTATKTCEWDTEKDPSGAKSFGDVPLVCQDWDGHGEIIGMRATRGRLPGPEFQPPKPTKENLNPLAATADWRDGQWQRTSPWFPDIGAADPPCADIDDSACSDAACRAATARRAALVCMATSGDWAFAPKEPNLDLVVNDLVAIADDLWAQRSATPGGGPDVTPPTSTAVLDVEPTSYGWNNTDVTVTITAVDDDGGSGVKEIVYNLSSATTGGDTVADDSVELTITNEGTTNIEYFARDNAGNEEALNGLAVNIDKTPPTIDGSVDPPPNDAGWNNTDVTVTFTADDALSGIDTVTDPVTVTDAGADQEVVGVATDRAGNTASVGVIVNIDKTPPVITGLPEDCELWPPNHKMVEVADIVISDELSGVADSSTDAVSSEPDSGRTYGGFTPDVQIDDGAVQLRAERYSLSGRTYDLTVTATDLADNHAEGNATCTVPHDQRH
jgi:pimeloyl-ACP methyl ester carboxylesterase